MLTICREVSANSRTKLVYYERPNIDLEIDTTQINFQVQPIFVNFSSGWIVRLLSFPRVFLSLFGELVKYKPEKVLVESYDMSIPVLFFKIFVKRNLNVAFYCRDMIKVQYSKGLVSFIFRTIERVIMSKVDLLLTTSPRFYEIYYSKYFSSYRLLENAPSISLQGQKNASNTLRIAFIGIVRYVDRLRRFVEVLESLDSEGFDIRLDIYGGGLATDIERLKSFVIKKNILSFHGPYSYSSDIRYIYNNSDISLALYDSQDFNCQHALPNKFYESIATNTPLIVSSGTYLGELVESKGMGVAIDPNDRDSIQRLLKDALNGDLSWLKSAQNSLEDLTIESVLKSNRDTIEILKKNDWDN